MNVHYSFNKTHTHSLIYWSDLLVQTVCNWRVKYQAQRNGRMHPLLCFAWTSRTTGPQGPLQCSSTPPPFISVSHLISLFCTCLFLSAFTFCFYTRVLHVSLLLTCWDSCGQRSGHGWRGHFLCAGTCVCELITMYPVSLQDTKLLGSSSTLRSMCKSVSVAAALRGWAIGTKPLLHWIGNPV